MIDAQHLHARAPRLHHHGRAALLAVLVGALLTVTGCTANGTTPPPSTRPPSSPAVDPSACVPDPGSVIDRTQVAAATGKLPSAQSTSLDTAAAAAFVATAAPGAVVAVRSPQGTWVSAYGVSDLTTKEPLTPDVYHRIGSVTKTFTTTVIMQLVSQKKLSLSDPISDYVPNVPHGSEITILELANMTSGIANYTDDLEFMKLYLTDYSIIWTVDQRLATAFAMPRTSAPGAEFHYSNTNTVLLGEVIEKITGHPLAEELQRRIFDPLRLTHTSYPLASAVLPEPHAHGYTSLGIVDDTISGNAPTRDSTAWNVSQAGASGEIVSTVDDLLVYGRALGTGQDLLPRDAQIARLSSFPTPAGYGIGLNCVQGWLGHNGQVPGYNTALYYDTRTDTTVVVEVNGDHPVGAAGITPADSIFYAVAAALGRAVEGAP
ncbi:MULTISPECIES: serine hydrolase domain-containing protein [unclassified Microbacterium]|uniref:serine hydrolase domain-containing protein n=1 Tax=unclassified Microbacterium TaxID=2609290 RepID=UPI0036518EE6